MNYEAKDEISTPGMTNSIVHGMYTKCHEEFMNTVVHFSTLMKNGQARETCQMRHYRLCYKRRFVEGWCSNNWWRKVWLCMTVTLFTLLTGMVKGRLHALRGSSDGYVIVMTSFNRGIIIWFNFKRGCLRCRFEWYYLSNQAIHNSCFNWLKCPSYLVEFFPPRLVIWQP